MCQWHQCWSRCGLNLEDRSIIYPFQITWIGPTSLLPHLAGFLILFQLSHIQIVILCPSALVLLIRIIFCALATVYDRSVIFRACEVVGTPASLQPRVLPKFRQNHTDQAGRLYWGISGMARIVLRANSMLEYCCIVVLATNHTYSEDFHKAATLAVIWEKVPKYTNTEL